MHPIWKGCTGLCLIWLVRPSCTCPVGVEGKGWSSSTLDLFTPFWPIICVCPESRVIVFIDREGVRCRCRSKFARTMSHCCCLCVGSLEQLYSLVKQGAWTAAGESLFQLAAYNCSAEVSENGASCFFKACYNLVMWLKNSYDDLERQRAYLREQLVKPGVFLVSSAQGWQVSCPGDSPSGMVESALSTCQ